MSATLRFVLFCVVLAISACRPSDSEPSLPEPWNEVPAFTYFNRNAISSGVWDDQLFVLTEFTLAEVKSDGSARHRSLPFPLKAQIPFPLTRDYIVLFQAEPAGLVFVPTEQPEADSADRVRITFTELGYGSVLSPDQLSRLNMAVNNNGQLLLPLRKASGEEALFLFTVQLSADRQRVEDVSYQKIDDYPDFASVSTIQPMGTDFLVSLVSQLGYSFKVYPDGQTKKVSEDPVFKVYPDNNIWYGYGINGPFLSEDNGETWTRSSNSLLSLGLPNMSVLQGFSTIDGKRVVWDAIDIYELTARANQPGFENRRLDKEGLSGHVLLEFREWQGRVYAVTPTGVFSRSIEDFFSPAE